MQKFICDDMPMFLQNIIKKIKFDKLGILQKTLITANLSIYPQKNNRYDISVINSNVPQDFIDKFNCVDYKSISTTKLKEMQKFISDYVKNNGLI
jgi:hypothetical protein